MNSDKDISGYFVAVYQRMKEIDSEEFFLHTRMTRPVYDLLINLIKKTSQKFQFDFR